MRLEIAVNVEDKDEARLFEDACKRAGLRFERGIDAGWPGILSYKVQASDAMDFYFLGIYVGLAKAQKTLEPK